MTKIDAQMLAKLEKLARIRLGDDEKEGMMNDLNRIVGMFDKLQEVDTDGVEPTRHMVDHHSRYRADEVRGELSQSDALKNVPTTKDGYIAVPKFLKPKNHG